MAAAHLIAGITLASVINCVDPLLSAQPWVSWQELRRHLPVSLILVAKLWRSQAKMISVSKLGTGAVKCVYVCLGHLLNFHNHAGIG